MRRTNRTHTTIPAALSSSACSSHLSTILASPATTEVKSDLYRGKVKHHDGTVEFTVVTALKKLYKNKCAYCEKTTHRPKIDHHRPKGKVVSASRANLGYYWLAYEWSNLLPSCTDCNEVGVKGSKFPISGARNDHPPLMPGTTNLDRSMLKYSSTYNSLEKAYLLHPEYCDPKTHFKFDRDGKVIGRTKKGRETVSTLKLDNTDLNGWRKVIYKNHFNELMRILDAYYFLPGVPEPSFQHLIYKWTEQIVINSENNELDYTLFRKYLLLDINYFFIEPLDEPFQSKAQVSITAALVTMSH